MKNLFENENAMTVSEEVEVQKFEERLKLHQKRQNRLSNVL
ncbi:hypothetical protein [uncultured Chryseobacterium sp.]|nr:hypothetical protein [uncultured Chryseobacterium sp.]